MDVLKKVPVREQDAKVRATNFEEVCYGYNKEEAMEEASRCLKCKNAKCVGGCPVSINIPGFIKEVEAGNFEAAADVIAEPVRGAVHPRHQRRAYLHRKAGAVRGGLVPGEWICAEGDGREERP